MYVYLVGKKVFSVVILLFYFRKLMHSVSVGSYSTEGQGTKRIGNFFLTNRSGEAVAGINRDLIWKGKQFLMDTLNECFEMAAWQIGATDAVAEKHITRN